MNIFHQKKILSFLENLEKIYEFMDKSYENAALHYGFKCKGCEDNCCFTRFYHHTRIEQFYLIHGFNTLSENQKHEISERAYVVCKKTEKADSIGKKVRLMCPLNFNERCILYQYRPMICRLHGLAHELRPPGRPVQYSPGCDVFTKYCENHVKKYYTFDRTPFYMRMAGLERDLKASLGINEKIKMTVAEIIVDYEKEEK
ncbi:YkgJ family cysteine cluster protein [Candidatus Magnetomoraceae bacterium gMMP-15]